MKEIDPPLRFIDLPLRFIDVLLIKAIISGLGSLNGDECAVIHQVQHALNTVDLGDLRAYSPALREKQEAMAVASVRMSEQATAVIRGQLLSSVKAFTAADIPTVAELRHMIDKESGKA